MRSVLRLVATLHPPEALAAQLHQPGMVLLHSLPREGTTVAGTPFSSAQARYSFVTARPFLGFRSFGSRCVLTRYAKPATCHVQFGNPWRLLDSLVSRYELADEVDLPFPLGGCFGYWSYDLKNFVEPKLSRRAANDVSLPECHVGFYDSLVAFDHLLGKAWIISTGLDADGSRSEERAERQAEWWRKRIEDGGRRGEGGGRRAEDGGQRTEDGHGLMDEGSRHLNTPFRARNLESGMGNPESGIHSNFSRKDFLTAVERAQRYIRAGDIYQVNLAQRLAAAWQFSGWDLYEKLSAVSPAPFSAFLDCGEFAIVSSSPELFLRLSGSHIQTRPIKGTRPRSADPTCDAQLSYELQTSTKEMAELVMITDLLRNDLGKVCEYGSVEVPELMRLERYPQVQHLVSTVEGRLRPPATHLSAFASCFPGGSITGAPKFRAMEIIDELEPISRGPYTGALGYLGFNRESQLSIIIRTAICADGMAYFPVGAGIVADSDPEAEYEETLAKAGGFLAALNQPWSDSNQAAERALNSKSQRSS